MNRKRTIIAAANGILLLVLTALCTAGDSGIVVTPENLRERLTVSDNLRPGLPSSDGLVIDRKGYAFCYSEESEQAIWVQYRLTAAEVLDRVAKRKDDFREDPLVSTGSASLADYRDTGYDRGHLAPAADMAWSSDAMSESFYMSNMSPQKPGFNRGIWKKLEEKVRDYAVSHGAVYVVTGGVLKGNLPTIGDNRVSVPQFYYKVIMVYRQDRKQAIGFLLQNDSSSELLSSFAVTVDEVERVTGLDFFSRLPDDIENDIESRLDLSEWVTSAVSARTAESVRGSKTEEAEDGSELESGQGTYWLNTRSNVRHNDGCKYFRHTTKGRQCGPDEGKPCGICGG